MGANYEKYMEHRGSVSTLQDSYLGRWFYARVKFYEALNPPQLRTAVNSSISSMSDLGRRPGSVLHDLHLPSVSSVLGHMQTI